MPRIPLLLLAFTCAAAATANASPSTTAQQFLRNAPKSVRQAFNNRPGSKAGLLGLGEVLERGNISKQVLENVVSNWKAAPFLADMFAVLPSVDRVPGVETTLGHLASSSIGYVARGYAFEIIAGAGLEKRARAAGERVAGFSQTVNGCEVDVSLADGTQVEVKSLPGDRAPAFLTASANNAMYKAEAQLKDRCAGGKPAVLVIPPLYDNASRFSTMAQGIGTPFTVITVDPETCSTRKIFDSTAQANSALRNMFKGRLFRSGCRVQLALPAGKPSFLRGTAPWRAKQPAQRSLRRSVAWRR